MSKLSFVRNRMAMAALCIACVVSTLGSCAGFDLQEILKPTKIEKVTYKPTAKPKWKGQTVYIDFESTSGIWYYAFASNLNNRIRENLVEGMVDDKIFTIKDKRITKGFMYRIEVRIANPKIVVAKKTDVIRSMSATFRIKIYDAKNNLIASKMRDVSYNAPTIAVSVGNSQDELVSNYAWNSAQEIRQLIYESLD